MYEAFCVMALILICLWELLKWPLAIMLPSPYPRGWLTAQPGCFEIPDSLDPVQGQELVAV